MITPVVLAAALFGPVLAQGPAPPPPPPADLGIQAQPLPPPSGAPAPPQAQPPAQWVPRGTADLEVLDKLEAVSRRLAVPVGQSAQVGSLVIAVKACIVRAPDEKPDSAAYLVINDVKPDEPGFRGWMLENEPWVAMLQSPLYDVRVTGCT